MNFTWVCYKSGESVDDTASWSLQEVYPDGSTPTIDGSPVTPEQTGGCFDTGPGRLPFNDTVITFDNSLMITGNTYYISLRVHKGNRVGTYRQRFTIAEPPPAFNIRYAKHCRANLRVAHYLSERVTSLALKTIDKRSQPLALHNNRVFTAGE